MSEELKEQETDGPGVQRRARETVSELESKGHGGRGEAFLGSFCWALGKNEGAAEEPGTH